MDKKNEKLKWYESGNIIVNMIIGVILLIIICSQSFAVVGEGSFSLFNSIINHNAIYLLLLIYFILLKTKKGKQYFNYLNIYLVFIYSITTITSLLTVVQSFSIDTVFTVVENIVILLYLFHTMFRDTRLWREYHLGQSPFNEISNEGFFNAILIIVVITLIVHLISTVVVSGLFLSILDALFVILFARYIYLYREYLDFHQLDSKNEGNFDEVRKDIQKVLDSTTIDEKAVEVFDKVKDTTVDIMDKTGIRKKEEKKTEKKTAKKEVKEIKEEKPKRKRTVKKKGEDK